MRAGNPAGNRHDLFLQGADVMRFVKVVAAAGLACMGLGACVTTSPADPASLRLAAEVPIFDMHMHIYRGLASPRLLATMDRNGVRWGGGVGAATPFAEIRHFREDLKDRYYPTLAQGEMAVSYSQGGVAAMENEIHPSMKWAIEQGPAMLSSRQAFGYGELILNNLNSSGVPAFRRRARVDAPIFRKMFALVAEHGGIVQLHIEPHSASILELRNLLRDFPQVPVVLSHCLAVTTGPSEVEALFDAWPQVHCELSSRSQTSMARLPAAQVYGFDFARPQWLASIEKYPDRYMVGTDVTSDSESFDDEVKQIRNGLLARLKPETLLKVANGNAKRLMKVGE